MDGGCGGEAEHPKGDPANPLSPAELTHKIETLTRHCYDADRRTALINAVQHLPHSGTLATILDVA